MTAQSAPPTHTYASSAQFLLGALQLFVAPWAWVWLIAGTSARARRALTALGVFCCILAAWPFVTGALVGGRALFTIGLAISAIALDHRPSNPTPSLISSLPTAQLASIASYIWLMDEAPDEFPLIWTICSSPAALETAQEMLIASLLSYELGRYIVNRLGLAQRVAQTSARAFEDLASDDFVLVAIAAAGTAVFALILSIRGLSYLSTAMPEELAGFLGNVDFLYYVGLYAAVSAAIRRRWHVGIVSAWVVLALAYELISGSKGRFAAYILIPLIAVYALGRTKVPLRATAIVIVAGMFSWLVIFPTLIVYRNQMEVEGMSDDPVAALATARGGSSEAFDDHVLSPIFDSQLAEQAAAMTSIIYFDVRTPAENLPARLFLFWVPRAVWPEKPYPLSANRIGRESHRLSPADETTSVIITSVGEQYAYLGKAGAFTTILLGLAVGLLGPSARTRSDVSDLEIGLVAYLLRLIPAFVSATFESSLTGFGLQTLALTAFLLAVRSLRPRPTAA